MVTSIGVLIKWRYSSGQNNREEYYKQHETRKFQAKSIDSRPNRAKKWNEMNNGATEIDFKMEETET